MWWWPAWATRGPARARWSSARRPTTCSGGWPAAWALGGPAATLVWDREGALHAGGGRASEALAAFCGRLGSAGTFAGPATPRPRGSSSACRATWRPTSSRAGALPTSSTSPISWIAGSPGQRADAPHPALPAGRSPGRGAGGDGAAARPEPPDLDPRRVLRVPADPYVRVDTCDYSLDPRLVGRRVEVRVGQAEISATALDTGELAARHRRSYARHRTITDPAHQRRSCARAPPRAPSRPSSAARSRAMTS